MQERIFLYAQPAYSTPPVDMVTFKKDIDSFTVLITDAEDGGKKAISAKNKQREAMVKMVTQLGHYVEAACNDDLATFNTSGFVALRPYVPRRCHGLRPRSNGLIVVR